MITYNDAELVSPAHIRTEQNQSGNNTFDAFALTVNSFI